MIDPTETPRLDELLLRFELSEYRESILAQGDPCISIALVDPPSVPKPDLPAVPLGASKVGGEPDLPPGVAWPADERGRAGFFLQISLTDLPIGAWNPLSSRGLLYLFCHDDCRAFWDPPGWEILWWDGDVAELCRAERDSVPMNEWVAENSFFSDSVARPLTFRAGTDFPPGSSGDWSFVNELHRRTRTSDPGMLDRYFEFVRHAADPGLEADLACNRGPHFHPIGRLLGHTDLSIREDLTLADRGAKDRFRDYAWRKEHRDELAREGAAWRQLLRLESNPATRYMSPSDAAPVFVMARDTGKRPWAPGGRLVGLASK